MKDSKLLTNNDLQDGEFKLTFPVYHIMEIKVIRDDMHHKALEVFGNQILELNGFILLKHEEEKFFYFNLISITQDDLNVLRKMKDILKEIDSKNSENSNIIKIQKINSKLANIKLSLQKLESLINLIPSKK